MASIGPGTRYPGRPGWAVFSTRWYSWFRAGSNQPVLVVNGTRLTVLDDSLQAREAAMACLVPPAHLTLDKLW